MDNLELSVQAVRDRLNTRWLGHQYHFFEAVLSTNSLLKEQLAAPGGQTLADGTVFLADFQEAGRGRLARRWLAPPGTSLLLSILLRPSWPAKQLNWLTMVAGVAAAEAIEAETPLTVAVKWPNDVMIMHDGVWHKAGGILMEGDLAEDGRLRSVILGIGINVNIPADVLPEAATPAISLLAVVGRPVSRLSLLCTFLARLEAHYDAAQQGQSPKVPWQQRLMLLGQSVQVTTVSTGTSIKGIAEGTDEWGQLLIRDELGDLHTITAGDVTLRSHS